MRFAVLRLAGADGHHRSRREIALLEERSAIVECRAGDATSLAGVDAVLVAERAADPELPVLAALDRFAAGGGVVLGWSLGFATLCERGLLDGAVGPSDGDGDEVVYCVVEGRPTPFTHAIPAGRHLRAELTGPRLCYRHPDPERLEDEGRVALRFCTADGEVDEIADPCGSIGNIAGVCSADGNVVGILPQVPIALFDAVLAWKSGGPARV
jgi:phosphoribosylformylglycinamidine synthase